MAKLASALLLARSTRVRNRRGLNEGLMLTKKRGFELVYSKVRRRLMREFGIKYRKYDEHNLAEFVDAGMERALNQLDRFSFRERPDLKQIERWAYRVAFNETINQIRKKGRRERRSTEFNDTWDAHTAKQSTIKRPDVTLMNEQERAEWRKAMERVLAIMETLDPRVRNILTLRSEGLSYDKLAEILDVEIGTVKSRLNRARKALARELLGDPMLRENPQVVGIMGRFL